MSNSDLKIFISGAITKYAKTDEGKRFVSDKFMGKEFDLITLYRFGAVYNPIRLIDELGWDAPHEEYMKRCLEGLKDCDVVYFFRDWWDSKGARIEHEKALELNKDIIYEVPFSDVNYSC